MGKFLLRLFAVIGIVFTILIASIIGLGMRLSELEAPIASVPEAMILTLDFSKPVADIAGPSWMAAFKRGHEGMSLLSIVAALEKAKNDPRVKAVVARFGEEQPSLVLAQELRAALQGFATSGKPTYAFAPTFGEYGRGNRSYYLASAFNDIWLQPVGTVGLTTVGAQVPFGKKALASVGIVAEFFQREEYKSAMEGVTRDDISTPARADLNAMLKNLNEQIATGIAESRKWDVAKVEELMANGPYTAKEAVENKLVSRLGYEDEVVKEVTLKAGKKAEQVDPDAYLSFTDQAKPKATVALISASGLIMDGIGGPAELTGGGIVDSRRLFEAFHEAAEDEAVKAILFRIDSPGGSPVASETIRRAMIVAKKAGKPVFVSMGETAASGGYWIAMDADRIIASPSTLTGSIGVIAGKFSAEDLWKKLGVKWTDVGINDNAQMWSIALPFNAAGKAKMNRLVDETYQVFISNVSAARKIPLERMSEVAKGRVWTGEQALKVGLVDELGGFSTAVQAVKKHLKLKPTDSVTLESFPAEPSPFDTMLDLMHSLGGEGVMLGRFWSALRKDATLMSWMREMSGSTLPVAARLPEGLRVR